MKCVVTGGSGFIGAYLVKRLLKDGHDVSVIDNCLRGDAGRLDPVIKHIKYFNIDIRDANALSKPLKNADVIFHLAAINGTSNFYDYPDLVLEVGCMGAINIARVAQKMGVPDIVYASSAEVYQNPLIVPTPENVELKIPNSDNPRYSYAGSKIMTELVAFNFGREFFNKVQVFRPHNVYGPDMGWKHVIPQFIEKAKSIKKNNLHEFEVIGSGTETRAFCYVDDVIDGIILMYFSGLTREVYHIGNTQEISMLGLAQKISEKFGLKPVYRNIDGHIGGTPRRCPNIDKMCNLGFAPKVGIDKGLKVTSEWYSTRKDTSNNAFL